MRNFYAGVVFTIAAGMFVKIAYELGKKDERKLMMKELRNACGEVIESHKKH